ncbi:uncharacterized protein LOC115558259 [Gadus morhua]|uniref:Uncharacterized LOC115558259 n=1 Tax=Gadus morhua TaxID=8049 RepID=A0A8C4ZJ13_GADMO|nr:uncharacterized protein LOC115558259 [Gadus morhua]
MCSRESTMAKRAILMLLPTLLGIALTQENFYGESLSFRSLQKKKDGTVQVSFYYRENGRGSCKDQLSYRCEIGYCNNTEDSKPVLTDSSSSAHEQWCQSEGQARVAPLNNHSLVLNDTGCCWPPNVHGKTKWMAGGKLDLGYRSDTHTYNKIPVTATVPYLRVPQNCFTKLRLLAYDPDGDHVRCLFASTSVDSKITLNENECTIKATGLLDVGLHVFELVLEDHPKRDVNLTYDDGSSSEKRAFNIHPGIHSTPFSQIYLQFTLQILYPAHNCIAGHVVPQYLLPTASHGDVRQASVGERFQLHIHAQASETKIMDFQISGPQNMAKNMTTGTLGNASVILNWTPALNDLYRLVPVCFTAETYESQSEMRCVIVMVTRSSTSEGKAVVKCSATQMTVSLEKISMDGIDKNWLNMNDPSCSMSSNATHIMATMSFNTCGTKLEDNGNFLIFKNEINSFELPDTVITRRRQIKIGFSCQFPKTASVSGSYQLHNSDYIFTESSFGSFGYTFGIFKDSSFAHSIATDAYPMEVKLLDPVFMGIRAVSDLPNITLFVESCKATPDDNPENSMFYNIIQNGCVMDETFEAHTSDPTSFNFELQSFKFVGDFDQVYISCSVILCETGNPTSRCAQGCVTNPPKIFKRSLHKETAIHSISTGPLKLIREVNSPDLRATVGAGKLKALLGSNTSSAVLGSLFTITVLVLAGFIAVYVRKSKTVDRATLITECEG